MEEERTCLLCTISSDVPYNGPYTLLFENGHAYDIFGLLLHAMKSQERGGHGYLPPNEFLEDMNAITTVSFPCSFPGAVRIGTFQGGYKIDLYPAKTKRMYPLLHKHITLALLYAERVRSGKLPREYRLFLPDTLDDEQ